MVRYTMFGRLPVKEETYLMCESSSKYGKSPYYFGYNESIESYKKGINDIILNDELEEVKVLGIIKNGTTIISNKLIEYHLCSLFFGCGITYEISGEILDGEFAGKKINDFKGVSIFQPGRLVDIQSFSPQPGLLKIKT